VPTPVISRRTFALSGAAVATAGLLGACGSKARSSGPRGTEKVSILTGASFQGREAPIFVARDKGWFAEAGLEVQVLPGKGTTENLKTLVGGQATFATLDVSASFIESSKPNGIKNFRLTSVLHQRNLACFLALERSGIKTPSDLVGKTISFIPGGINYELFSTYARLANFDPAKVKWVNIGPPQNATMLAQGKVDAISQFVPAVTSVQGLASQPITVLPFTDYITDLHGSAIGVTTETAQTKPDLVRRFNRALLKGLQYAIDHPDETGQIYVKQQEAKGQSLVAAVGEINGMSGYVHTAAIQAPFGHFDPPRVARNIAILRGAGTIPDGSNPTDIVSFDLAG
jgi:NitT/TauT family transport system substrate-binding protein